MVDNFNSVYINMDVTERLIIGSIMHILCWFSLYLPITDTYTQSSIKHNNVNGVGRKPAYVIPEHFLILKTKTAENSFSSK